MINQVTVPARCHCFVRTWRENRTGLVKRMTGRESAEARGKRPRRERRREEKKKKKKKQKKRLGVLARTKEREERTVVGDGGELHREHIPA